KIWQNECNGTISGLTSWNAGEDFASLGIGHFIWYPKGRRGPFEESFPKLVSFISKRGAKLPALLLGTGEKPCPWNSRTEFLRAQLSTEKASCTRSAIKARAGVYFKSWKRCTALLTPARLMNSPARPKQC